MSGFSAEDTADVSDAKEFLTRIETRHPRTLNKPAPAYLPKLPSRPFATSLTSSFMLVR
jgi:hypothetical protein